MKTMEECERESSLRVAEGMLAAAKTAPKGSGKDKVVGVLIEKKNIEAIAQKMEELAKEYELAFFKRDAENLRKSHCMIVLGAKAEPFGLTNCAMCGFKNCGLSQKAGANCAFNITDLGIAIGSAVAYAADNRIDNRVMYSAGRACIKLGVFDENVRVAYGIPLSTSSKSIFFDRNPGAVLL